MPITPGQLAVEATAAVAAGAEALHLHPRDRFAAESLHPDDVAAAVTAVRPLATVAGWADLPSEARPDFASVNVSEVGFADLVEALHRAGIAVEAGVWSTADAQTLAAAGRGGWIRILVEIVDGTAETAVAAADAILASLDELGVAGPRLRRGEEAACWPLVAHAGRLGCPPASGWKTPSSARPPNRSSTTLTWSGAKCKL